jgi:hypothetical protein
MSMKNSNDIIGNRTRDLPACSTDVRVQCIINVIVNLITCVFVWLNLWILHNIAQYCTILCNIEQY